MRTIKFRAWDVRGNQMIENAISASETQKLLTTTLDLQNPFAYFDGLRWMEYIGFNDKNNKEIYEGDIIIFDNGGNDKGVFIVKYMPTKACFSLDSPSRFLDFMAALYESRFTTLNQDKFEVIGNIYANPELIEQFNLILEGKA